MSELLQQVINGISLGSIYALIALGYTMIYGILRFINFAHGDVFMIGAFAGFYLAPHIQNALGGIGFLSGIVVMLAAMAVCSILGVAIEKAAYRPLRSRPKLTVLITAIGVSLFLEYGGQLIFGPDPKLFPTLIPVTAVINTNNLVVTTNSIVVIGTALILMLLLRLIVFKTRLGTAMRAVSYDHRAAALMGINIDTVISFTFVLGVPPDVTSVNCFMFFTSQSHGITPTSVFLNPSTILYNQFSSTTQSLLIKATRSPLALLNPALFPPA